MLNNTQGFLPHLKKHVQPPSYSSTKSYTSSPPPK